MEYEYKRTDTESEDSSTESQKATLQQFNQSQLNDLVRDLDLSKQADEILASRLNEKHVLHSSAKVSYFRKRGEHFITFFLRGIATYLLRQCTRTFWPIRHLVLQSRRMAPLYG